MLQFKPKDIIAILCIIFVLVFKYKGFNGQLDAILSLIIGYYFAHRINGDDQGK